MKRYFILPEGAERVDFDLIRQKLAARNVPFEMKMSGFSCDVLDAHKTEVMEVLTELGFHETDANYEGRGYGNR